MLLERLEPGTMLARMPGLDDDDATRIAVDLLRRLWRSPEAADDLILLDSWCAAYDRNRQLLSRGVVGFPAELFRRADSLRAELLSSTDHSVCCTAICITSISFAPTAQAGSQLTRKVWSAIAVAMFANFCSIRDVCQ